MSTNKTTETMAYSIYTGKVEAKRVELGPDRPALAVIYNKTFALLAIYSVKCLYLQAKYVWVNKPGFW